MFGKLIVVSLSKLTTDLKSTITSQFQTQVVESELFISSNDLSSIKELLDKNNIPYDILEATNG